MKTLMLLMVCFSIPVGHAGESESFNFPSSKVKELLIRNSYGNIEVAASNNGKTELVVQKGKWGPKCHLQTVLTKGKLEIRVDDDSWMIEQNCQVDLFVSVPEKLAMDLVASSGNIRIVGSRGNVEAKVGTGTLLIKSDLARLRALSGQGNIFVDGEIRDIDIRSGKGDVEVSVQQVPQDSNFKFLIGQGELSLNLPHASKVAGKLATANGEVVRDFPLNKKAKGLTIDANVGSGNIYLKKR